MSLGGFVVTAAPGEVSPAAAVDATEAGGVVESSAAHEAIDASRVTMSAAPVTRRPLERTAEVIIRAEYPATHAGPRRPGSWS
jgi:hypothetical protein